MSRVTFCLIAFQKWKLTAVGGNCCTDHVWRALRLLLDDNSPKSINWIGKNEKIAFSPLKMKKIPFGNFYDFNLLYFEIGWWDHNGEIGVFAWLQNKNRACIGCTDIWSAALRGFKGISPTSLRPDKWWLHVKPRSENLRQPSIGNCLKSRLMGLQLNGCFCLALYSVRQIHLKALFTKNH